MVVSTVVLMALHVTALVIVAICTVTLTMGLDRMATPMDTATTMALATEMAAATEPAALRSVLAIKPELMLAALSATPLAAIVAATLAALLEALWEPVGNDT